MRALILLVTLGACAGAQLRNGGDDDDNPPPGVDAPVVGDDAPAACANGRKVYLNFDGVTLNDGATSNAKNNIASWMTNGVTTANVPPYKQGVANRDAIITSITQDVTNRLAPFPTEVVTTRPATGDYMMVVFGGTAANVGSRFIGVQELDCGDVVRNDVAWIADNLDTNFVVNVVMGSIGFGIGLTATADDTDCMCSWDNTCRYANSNCTLHDGIPRDQTANQLCPNAGATQDEIVAFNTAFCN